MELSSAQGAHVLSERDFARLAEVVEKNLGIKMPASKRLMMQSRLLRRIRAKNLPSFRAYVDHLLTPAGFEQELVHFLDLSTTNKTSFFREAEHFTYLRSQALPALVGNGSAGGVRVWSAACSTGQEPWTIGMVVHSFLATHAPHCQMRILATDVSTRVLETAERAVYPMADIEDVPQDMRRNYLLKSKDSTQSLVRISPVLRSCVTFRRLNFMDPDYRTGESFDVIFCRNALIYFERATQEQIVNKLCKCLRPGGFLFSGLAESLHGYDLPIVHLGRSVYQKRERS